MFYPTKICLVSLLFMNLLFATACGSDDTPGGSNDGGGGTGGGGFTCDADDNGCDEGFECDDSGDLVECVDVDECAEGTHDCDDGTYCENGDGSFSCESCPAGHELDGDECVDVDECAEGTHDCDEHASCENTEGSYECSCDDGFSGDGSACADVNECAEGTHDCGDGTYCVNDDGSFSCESCPAGHELDGDECVDVDECAEGTHDCDEHASCENTEGSYECSCDDGFSGDGSACADVNECAEGTHDCGDGTYCVNDDGSFSCESCPAGYEIDGDGCVDVDECAVANGGCGDVTAGTCENTDGGFHCVCHEAHALVGGSCVYTSEPQVVTSTPANEAVGVYPAEYYWDPAPMRGVRERVFIRLTFNMAMDTEEASVVLTDADGLEEPRVIEGSWDDTGHTLTAIVVPHDDAALYPLEDETTYHLSFSDLRSSGGTAVNLEDPAYPQGEFVFTTGVRDALLNHACIHTQHGPFDEVTANTSSTALFPGTDTPHTHYTITLPEGSEGEPNVGYTAFFPNNTGVYVFYLRDASTLQLETTGYFAGFEPWVAAEVEAAPAACHSVDSVVTDSETGERTTGPPVTGITHQITLTLSEEELYVFRWTSPEDLVQVIVEYAGAS